MQKSTKKYLSWGALGFVLLTLLSGCGKQVEVNSSENTLSPNAQVTEKKKETGPMSILWTKKVERLRHLF